MQSFATFRSAPVRWFSRRSLAMAMSNMAHRSARDYTVRRLIPTWAALGRLTPADLAANCPAKGQGLAYLRANPSAVTSSEPSTWQLPAQLRQSFKPMRRLPHAPDLPVAYSKASGRRSVLATRDGDREAGQQALATSSRHFAEHLMRCCGPLAN